MKKLFILLLSLCATYGFADTNDIGKVYHMSFDTQRCFPFSELMIEGGANCSATIEQNEFEEMLEPTTTEYDSGIIYNKITFKDKTYYIDREGIVSDSKNIYQLKSKEQYEKVLKENNLVCK